MSIMNRLIKSLSSHRNAVVYMEMSLWSPSISQVSSCALSRQGARKAVPASQAESKYSCLEKQDPFSWSKDKAHLRLALFEPQKKKPFLIFFKERWLHVHLQAPKDILSLSKILQITSQVS